MDSTLQIPEGHRYLTPPRSHTKKREKTQNIPTLRKKKTKKINTYIYNTKLKYKSYISILIQINQILKCIHNISAKKRQTQRSEYKTKM